MLRKVSFAVVIAASLSLPTIAFAAPVHGKRHVVHHWHGYGFLPGYRPPDPVDRYRAPRYWYGDRSPRYWYGGGLYYFGRPGFYNGRWNGGSFGPCWRSTPIGLMWTCG